jgi:hypothetical protein
MCGEETTWEGNIKIILQEKVFMGMGLVDLTQNRLLSQNFVSMGMNLLFL